MEDIALPETLLKSIINLIINYKAVDKIAIFGSRARNDNKPHSDIDIVIWDKDLSHTDINIIKNKLEEEIHTVLKFDVLNFYKIEKKSLAENILEDGVMIYESRNN